MVQIDDETLLVARDVRVLRQRRKQANEEAKAQWERVQAALPDRQAKEKEATIMQLRINLAIMSPSDVEATKSRMMEELQEWRQKRDEKRAQLDKLMGVGPEANAPQPEAARKDTSRGLGRKLSFGKKDKDKIQQAVNAAPTAPAAQAVVEAKAEPNVVRKSSFGKGSAGSTITRVLSFGRSGKPKEAKDAAAEDSEKKKGSTAGNLVRKLSFGKKK